ncbi:long-chain-fatty acid CoA ligase [Acidovorax sp. KKS102]|uniref:AMP-binding protein n=1 Tax=Acidovorax sp. KKS102 TaxID=358220 RepID=UPI00028B82A2|nr:AMP-binding protein [Acidovorax sp. KKS102]AFU46943.1 long-chain-fatty acid CoA ligase [Acidovorax sp. KKS102]
MLDLGRTFLQSVDRSANTTALVDGSVRLTWGEWARAIGGVQRGLAALGLRHGDHVLSVLQNRYEAATLHWACQFSGLVMTPLNWRAKPEEVDYVLRDSEARLLVFEAASEESLESSVLGKTVTRMAVGTVHSEAPRFDDLLKERRDPTPLARAEDLSLMLYTSGTTGAPKGVPRRQRTERVAALAHVAQNRYAYGERTLGVMPLYHTMGVRSLLTMALVDGRFVCMPRFDAATALRAIESERVSHLYLVPTLYHDLLAHPEFKRTDTHSVRKLGFAGAPMHDALLLRLQQAFQPELFVNHYGSSEIYTFSINQDAVGKPGSAGRAGINTRLRVIKLDAKSPEDVAAPLEEGQIVAELLSDEAFEGYHNRPEANARSLRDGWYFTGDTGYLDAEGDLFVTGRVDDMIISGGENISPVDIESVLSLHPSVDEVAVAGLKDERWGQRVVAFVKAHDAVGADALDAHCRASDLVNFKRPREYVFVREIPKSPVGKVLRRKLVAGEFEAARPPLPQVPPA